MEAESEFLEASVIGDADAGEDGYVTIGEMLDDEIVTSPVCPICGTPLVKQERTLHSKGQKYTFLFNCPTDGNLLMVLKLHRNFNDTWRARRTLAHASEEEVAEFKKGLERTAVRKKVRHHRPRGPRRYGAEPKKQD